MNSRRVLERAFDATVENMRLAAEVRGLIPIIVVDLFSGAGGASQGLLRALELAGLTPTSLAAHGYYLRLININHWEIAIDTIKRNIAFAEMYNATIENWSPEELLQGQRVHLLIAAPECITYSKARGKRPIKDQSRTTAAWVVDWVKTQPHALYFENVSEWRTWGPLDDNMDPIREREGEYFDAFVAEIRGLGYSNFAYDDFVCAMYGDATTRERFFALAWHDEYELSPSFPPATHTKYPDRFPELLPYRDARSCIDFTRPSSFITERDTIHAPATLRRIGAGFAKQDTFDRPMLTEIVNRMVPIATAAHERLNARPTEGKLKRKPTREEQRDNELILADVRAKARQQLRDIFSTPLAVFDPADVPESVKMAIGTIVGQHPGNGPRQVDEPLMTIEAKGAIGLADPFLCKNNASEKSAFDDHTQSIDKPYATIVAKDCRALAEPSLVVVRHGVDDIRTPDTADPLGTLTTKNELGLAQPTILHLYSSNIVDDVAADRGASDITEPVSTISAGGNHHALAQPVIQHLYGGSVETGGSLPDQPLPTVMTVNHHALAEPFVTKIHGEKRDGDLRTMELTQPIGTVAAGGNQHGLAEPFITKNYGEQHAGEDRTSLLKEPIDAIPASAKHGLAEPTLIPQHFDAEPQSPQEPLPTVVAIVRIGLAEPTIVSNHHQNIPTETTQPLGTATTATGGGMFLAEPTIVPRNNAEGGRDRRARKISEPLPTATTSGVGNLAQPFLTPNFGERDNQAPRNHSIDAPVPAVTSHGAGMLVDITFSEGIPPNTIMPFFLIGTQVVAINIRYRMLHSSELAAAHSLDHVKFSGTETDAIRQIGNSIPARTAAAFITHALRPIFARLALPMRKAA